MSFSTWELIQRMRILNMLWRITLALLIFLAGATTVAFLRYSSESSDRYAALLAGGEIAATEAGPIEYLLKGDQGPVLLFLHGTPGGYDQAPDADAGYRVLAPSRPGYLGTPIDTGRTPAEQARAYAQLLDALDIDSVVVMGASGGGPSALSFAATYPRRTIALIAIEAVSQSTPLPEVGPFRWDFLYWLALSTSLNLVGIEGIVAAQIPDPANQQRILADPDKTEQFTAVIWSIWPASRRAEGWQNDEHQFNHLELPIANITAPTLIIHGNADTNVPFSHGELLARQIPHARFHVVHGGDHMMPFSHSEEVEAAISEFLRETGIVQ
jgi:pimeloyl-ACP methyl ester carboxylesterase